MSLGLSYSNFQTWLQHLYSNESHLWDLAQEETHVLEAEVVGPPYMLMEVEWQVVMEGLKLYFF
jgi:hypothetical protein